MPKAATVAELRARLDRLAVQGHALELEGLPFPIASIHESFEQALTAGSIERATSVVKGGENLLAKVSQDWTWIRELLRRADELRAIASTLGVDLQHLDARVGNPRLRLQSDPLSSGSMEKAAASASLALAVLNDTIPKYCVQEAQNLGESIRRARNRGEDVRDGARSFTLLLQAIQDQNLALSAQRLVETRRAVSRIPRAPALPSTNPREEEEILQEARNLARRLQRIKGKARDAQTAARLMSQIRGALSEERRFGTPEEEIEALWLEVDRITRERRLASDAAPPVRTEPDLAEVGNGSFDALGAPPPGSMPGEASASGADAPSDDDDEEGDEDRRPPVAFAPYDPYIPPDIPLPTDTEQDPNSPAARARARGSRVRP
jgi:CHASE3 domain sensor protein